MTGARRIRPVVAGALLAAFLLLAACGKAEPSAAPVTEATTAPAPSAAAATASATPSPAVFTPPADMKLKTVFKYTSPTGEQLTAQVIAHKSVSGAEGVDVKVCNSGTIEFSVTRGPWALLYDGGDSEHNIDITGGGLPAPAYPDVDPKKLTTGKCARGWINWASIDGKKPYGVVYKADDNSIVWKF